MQAIGDVKFSEGESRVSGTLYMAGEEHLDLLNRVYSLFSHTNPMHTDVFPSVRQMESEVVAMTASLLGGAPPLLSPAMLSVCRQAEASTRSVTSARADHLPRIWPCQHSVAPISSAWPSAEACKCNETVLSQTACSLMATDKDRLKA